MLALLGSIMTVQVPVALSVKSPKVGPLLIEKLPNTAFDGVRRTRDAPPASVPFLHVEADTSKVTC